MSDLTRVAFISGPLRPSPTYFATHYEPKLLHAIDEGHSFVMGPAEGIDTIALRFLYDHVSADRITVFLSEFENTAYRPRLRWFEESGGKIVVTGVTTGERDAAATSASNYDILRYLTVEEAKLEYGAAWYQRVTATEMNERRRKLLLAEKKDVEKKGVEKKPGILRKSFKHILHR